MDKLFIHDLKIETLIGAYEWERRVRQNITVDLEYGINAKSGASNDDLNATCNYIEVGKKLIEFIGQSEFYLIETLAEKTAETLQAEFKLPWLKLRIRKLGTLSQAREVGIEIERGCI